MSSHFFATLSIEQIVLKHRKCTTACTLILGCKLIYISMSIYLSKICRIPLPISYELKFLWIIKIIWNMHLLQHSKILQLEFLWYQDKGHSTCQTHVSKKSFQSCPVFLYKLYIHLNTQKNKANTQHIPSKHPNFDKVVHHVLTIMGKSFSNFRFIWFQEM